MGFCSIRHYSVFRVFPDVQCRYYFVGFQPEILCISRSIALHMYNCIPSTWIYVNVDRITRLRKCKTAWLLNCRHVGLLLLTGKIIWWNHLVKLSATDSTTETETLQPLDMIFKILMESATCSWFTVLYLTILYFSRNVFNKHTLTDNFALPILMGI